MHELILGGQKSGKSHCAERRACAWLAEPAHDAVLVATALAGDAEMQRRIARHRAERAERVPRLRAAEVPIELAEAIAEFSAPHRMVVVDCLSMWLTNQLMPLERPVAPRADATPAVQRLCETLRGAAGPVVLVSNEIGLGVSPISGEARRFIDTLGRLHQALAAHCSRVTLLVAGIELPVKRESA